MKLHSFSLKGFPTKEYFLVFQDWFLFLAKESFGVSGTASNSSNTSGDPVLNEVWNVRLQSNESLAISFLGKEKKVLIECPFNIRFDVKKVVESAQQNVQQKLSMPGCWWVTSFQSAKKGIDQSSMLHMLRHLSDFKRGAGKIRLGRNIILDVKDDADIDFSGFPNVKIKAIIFTGGACHGPFAKLQLENLMPVINAVISCCFSTPLMSGLSALPAKQDEINSAQEDILSSSVGNLAFHGLDICEVLCRFRRLGNFELSDRLIGALMAYEAAMLQRTDHAALLFCISAIEALTVPNLDSAKKQRVSKRFSFFLESFCSEEIDKVMKHINFTQAFGEIKTRKKFIDELYELRSQRIHTGHFGNYSDLVPTKQSLKVGLVSSVVIAAIVAFMKSPVTLLWGHPTLDPTLMIQLDSVQLEYLQVKAKKSRITPEKYIQDLVLKDMTLYELQE